MTRLNSIARLPILLLLAAAFVVSAGSKALAQYNEKSLVTTSQDPNIANAWGIAYLGSNPFWVSNEASGTSTLYTADGSIVPLVVTVPPAVAGGKGSPTGIVGNSTTGFVITQNAVSGPAAFIFDTLDGTISGWNPSVNGTNAVVVINNNKKANYVGLAIATAGPKTYIYAANAAANVIEQYDSNYHLVRTFTDASHTGLKVYGIQAINNRLYVTFQGPTGAAVDIFGPSGNLQKKLISNGSAGPMVGPWGLALAPANFGQFSNALLVGNVDDGKINAFNATTGAFLGTMTNKAGKPIINAGLWGMVFGGGNATNGRRNQLFITAGTGHYVTGLFAVINPVIPPTE